MAIIHMSYGSTKLESGLMMKHVTPYAKFFIKGFTSIVQFSLQCH